MNIGIITPSRGLIHSRTMESITEGIYALQDRFNFRFFTTHDKPIPEAQNDCLTRAFEWGAQVILSIEEDNVLDVQAFEALLTCTEPIAILQYNDRNGSPHGIIHKNEAGEIMWSGIGALKVDRQVFETIGKPYFRTDVRYSIKRKPQGDGTVITHFEEVSSRGPHQYGGLDVDFYTRARAKGYRVYQIQGHIAHHMKLNKLGETFVNNGCHDITTV